MFTVHPLGRPVASVVQVPGSKSMTNRALVAASLTRGGVSRLNRPLEADDTIAMRTALRRIGVLIDDNDDPWLVLGAGGELDAADDPLDVGASGTTARFITAVAALVPGRIVVDGTARMRQRPIGPLTDALAALGVQAQTRDGYPPVEIHGAGHITGGPVRVDSTKSSQFASALLLIAPMADEAVAIELDGPVVSRPYMDGTVEVMRAFGANVTVDGDRFTVQPTGYRKAHIDIEPDLSAAVYPAVAAAITGGAVEMPGIGAHSTQPDRAIFDVLSAMGCSVSWREVGVRVEGPDHPLDPVDVDLTGAPDGAMAVAAAALFADGPSIIHGLSTLRHKETDRLAALQTELRRLGAEVDVTQDSLRIRPGRLRGAEIQTYEDHRMAMSLALVGLVVDGVVISEPGVVTKTWPGFFDMLGGL